VARVSGVYDMESFTLLVFSLWKCTGPERVGRGAPIIIYAIHTVHCGLLMFDLVAEPNQSVIDQL